MNINEADGFNPLDTGRAVAILSRVVAPVGKEQPDLVEAVIGDDINQGGQAVFDKQNLVFRPLQAQISQDLLFAQITIQTVDLHKWE